MPWAMLTKMNYNGWSLVMKVKMHARQLCDVIEFGDAEFHNYWQVPKALLLVSVLSAMATTLADKLTVKHASSSIAAMRIDIDRVCMATL